MGGGKTRMGFTVSIYWNKVESSDTIDNVKAKIEVAIFNTELISVESFRLSERQCLFLLPWILIQLLQPQVEDVLDAAKVREWFKENCTIEYIRR